MAETCGKGVASGGREGGIDGPVFLRPEGLDFRLPVADQPERDRLDAPRRLRSGQLAPQYRRQRKADQIVERAAREIGFDQFLVERSEERRAGRECESTCRSRWSQHLSQKK